MTDSLQLKPSLTDANDAVATGAPSGPVVGPAAGSQPSDAEVARALGEIERATNPNTISAPISSASAGISAAAGNRPVIIFFAVAIPALVLLSFAVASVFQRAGVNFSKMAAPSAAGSNSWFAKASPVARQAFDPAAQAAAEGLLAGVAAGEGSAARQAIAESDWWTGHTHRTPRTNQLIAASLNSSDLGVRRAAIAAQLALDGVPRSQGGVAMLEQAAANPNQRAWAIWMLGALANRGMDPVHTAKVIESYLNEPDAQTRAVAVDGLSLVATDETVPMLLDRFRNDPSPIVQERAACDIAQAGMYSHAQRVAAAKSLVGWVKDPLLSAQQRGWVVEALTDISGKNLGPDPTAWRFWLDQQAPEN